MRRLTVAGIVGLGLLLSTGAVILVLASEHEDNPIFTATAFLLMAWAFILGGIVAWRRRPDNGFGLLMTAVGMTVPIGALGAANDSFPFTLGYVFGGIFIAVFIHALLAFPRGYLETRLVFTIVTIAYLILTAGSLLTSFFDNVEDNCADCPANAFLIVDSPNAVAAINVLLIAVGLPALAASLFVFWRRWHAASRPVRRVLAPVYLTAGVTLALLALTLLVGTFSEDAGLILFWILIFCFAAVPFAFILGLLSGRLARAGVGQLVLDLGKPHAPGELREALARALGDPTLRLAYWIPDTRSFADLEGNPIELPEPDGEELVTMVEREGRTVAALIHHRSLEEDPLLVESAAATAALALESERRHAALAKAQARNRALLDAVPDLMFRMTRDGVYLEVKGRAEDLAVPPSELIGSSAHEILPKDVADPLVEGVRRAIDTGEIVTGEYRLELDGRLRDFEARIVKAGEEAVLIVREFTERNTAQAELERLHLELQQRHRELEHERDFAGTVVDSTPSLLCLVTPGGYIVRFNHSLHQLSGRVTTTSRRGTRSGISSSRRRSARPSAGGCSRSPRRAAAASTKARGSLWTAAVTPSPGRRRRSATTRAIRASSSAAWTSPTARSTRPSSAAREPGSWRPATSSGGGWSATSTTAPSSASSRSPSRSGSRKLESPTIPRAPTACYPRPPRSCRRRSRSSASSPVGSTRRSSPTAGSVRHSKPWRRGHRSSSR